MWVPGGCLAIPVISINLWKILMFTCMQKINLITKFFLETSQTHCKVAWEISICLAKPIKNDIINLQKTLMFIITQNINLITSFYIYEKDIAYLLSWIILYKCLIMPIRYDSIGLFTPLMFICTKSSTSSHNSSLIYWKDTAYFLFWELERMPGHAHHTW